MRIALQPCGSPDARRHFTDTVGRPVDASIIYEFLDELEAAQLHGVVSESGSISVWGVTPGLRKTNEKAWGQLSRGDISLFARDNHIFASATIVAKAHSRELAEHLWGSDDAGNTWEYIYFLDDLRYRNITYREVNAGAGYSADFVIQGFRVLDPAKSQALVAHLGLLQNSTETEGVERNANWHLSPGSSILRKELHREFGGSTQGGMTSSTTSPNIFLFSDPDTGNQHGYFDGRKDDGTFHYTGMGQAGDQEFTSGNLALMESRQSRRSIRLFMGSRGQIVYEGRFELDPDEPYYWADAPQRGSSELRKVIMFRLRPTSETLAPTNVQQAPRPSPKVTPISIEQQRAEFARMAEARKISRAVRREGQLVLQFDAFAQARGLCVSGGWKIEPAGGGSAHRTDAYVKELNLLIEAKGNNSREAFRMAIGQLLDYRRHLDSPDCAILLPSKPNPDLLDLAARECLVVIWKTDDGFDASRTLW